jgi:hypothetical protein
MLLIDDYSDPMIVKMAGPKTITKTDGSKSNMMGARIFTGSFWAISRAFSRRSARIILA